MRRVVLLVLVALAPAVHAQTEEPLVTPTRVDVSASEAALRARWAAQGTPLWADGDTLTVVYEGDAETVLFCCAVQLPMERLPGSDLWVLSLRVPGLDHAVFSYGFFVPGSMPGPQIDSTWRGPAAPGAPARMTSLRGTIRTDSLWSDALGERRAVTTYLPPDHDPDHSAPVVYAADGQGVRAWASVIEPLVLTGEVPPLAIVGVHATARRTAEYTGVGEGDVPWAERERFEAHERFVLDEVVPWAEQTFGLSPRPADRVVYGVSNGGVFAALIGTRHPDRVGQVVSFSCGACAVVDPATLDATVAPRFYFLAGWLEPGGRTPRGFFASTRDAARRVRAAGAEAVFRQRVAGHDFVLWEESLPDALRWALGGRHVTTHTTVR